MTLAEREQEIETVRVLLHRLVEQKVGDFADTEVAELSRHLDQLIVEYEMASVRQLQKDKLVSA
ncbi:hypothetical protein SPACI_000810 [Sporomusa acidovorans DSM 3132]|uniref:Spo0E like sporulation regulatory protein n=1 Tax=Sporomusa acidovorans (strain ATCC 49682 / DSM 3132 / Mol) TaxID=1123286 RepID=A0ABZ3IW75_SPOA4|nr:Spo0E like sporulation regulatory protein [Sporomusa acidovorans DSM 3132]SDE91035.1 Spo0E like sporulation regulatory protein [Sporomusa acidovorans]